MDFMECVEIGGDRVTVFRQADEGEEIEATGVEGGAKRENDQGKYEKS